MLKKIILFLLLAVVSVVKAQENNWKLEKEFLIEKDGVWSVDETTGLWPYC